MTKRITKKDFKRLEKLKRDSEKIQRENKERRKRLGLNMRRLADACGLKESPILPDRKKSYSINMTPEQIKRFKRSPMGRFFSQFGWKLKVPLLLFFLIGCAGQSGVTPVGGGFGLINLGNPSVTRMDAWYQAPVQYQISHVHKIIQVLGDNGVRCNRPGVTVGFIRTELMTRANAGRYKPEDKLFDSTVGVLKDVCG